MIIPDYELLDDPFLINCLFFPRQDNTAPPPGSFDRMVQVGDEIFVACRFYLKDNHWPSILYFHGNGEVAADYDDIKNCYWTRELNLIVADYRGYGLSTGQPSFKNLIKDAHLIFSYVRQEILQCGFKGAIWVMGRSLGSMSALEVAYQEQKNLQGLIIESGFVCVSRLAKQWELPANYKEMEIIEKQCLAMTREIALPALVIHGEEDDLVYMLEGKLIYEQLGSKNKEFLVIPEADHNSIIFSDPEKYFGTLDKFIREA
ncbi:MAG: alpha/beta hydrolase [Syntrophomonadaceae bacterium]|nr:alpha/beta hydrolase [Syntrophomonadaceae bacterium]MDD3022601.1 alpha/beta hydrolase [Syntrophomonadaceae bacterium]